MFSGTIWCNIFLLANVSYAIWKSSQDRVSFNIFPSTHFWLTQNTKISKYLVCQEVSFPGLIDCQCFQNYWNKELKGDSMRWWSHFWFFHFQIYPTFKLLFLKFYELLQTGKPISHLGAVSGTSASIQVFLQREMCLILLHTLIWKGLQIAWCFLPPTLANVGYLALDIQVLVDIHVLPMHV